MTSIAKPIIHHITSTANLNTLNQNQSLLLSLNNKNELTNNNNNNNESTTNLTTTTTTTTTTSTSTNPITSSTNNHSAITGGLVLKPGDVWSQVVLRVIPLFNGEGHKGFIEDLNDFVSQHIHKTIADSPSKSINKLYSDITELFANGVMILNNKLQPDQLSDERLLVRVFEVWHFFFTGVLPYLEAIFLPLMSDENLLNVIESKNNKDLQERLQQQHLLQQATSSAHLFNSNSTSLWLRQSNRNTQNPSQHQPSGSHSSRTEEVIQEIDIRKLALLAFRQHLCLPIFSRLYKLFTMIYDPTTWKKIYGHINLSNDIQSEHMHLKRLQMVGLLSSVQSNNAQQPMMQELSKLIRLKKANPDLLKPPSTTTTLQNLPLRTASASGNTVSKSNNDLESLPDRDHSCGSSPSGSHTQQQQASSLNSHPSSSNLTKIDNQYDDDQPLVGLLQDDNPSQHIKGWNKNRDFARRSIRRQLSRSGTNSRAARENQQPNYQNEEHSDAMARRAESSRVRRNRTRQSISKVMELDGNSESSINRSGTSLLTLPTTQSVSNHQTTSSTSHQSQRPSLEGLRNQHGRVEEQSLEHLNENAYNIINSEQKEWSLGHRSRIIFGQKTGSGSSSGSIMSIMGTNKQNSSFQHHHNTVHSKSSIDFDNIDHYHHTSSSTTNNNNNNNNSLLNKVTKPLVIHHRVAQNQTNTNTTTCNSNQHYPLPPSAPPPPPPPSSSSSSNNNNTGHQLNLNIQPMFNNHSSSSNNRNNKSSSNNHLLHGRSLSASLLNDHCFPLVDDLS